MSINPIDLMGQTISFELYPHNIIGTRFENVIVRGVVDHSGVTGFNPAIMHSNVYPSIPPDKIIDDFKRYSYLRIELENKTITYVGLPWIIQESIVVSDNRELVITIRKSASLSDQEFVRRMLISNGIQDFDLKVK